MKLARDSVDCFPGVAAPTPAPPSPPPAARPPPPLQPRLLQLRPTSAPPPPPAATGTLGVPRARCVMTGLSSTATAAANWPTSVLYRRPAPRDLRSDVPRCLTPSYDKCIVSG